MDHFIAISQHTPDELNELIDLSIELKGLYKSGGRDLCLAGKTLAMLFEKTSLRTRMSFQIAMDNLGGNAIYMKPDDIGIIGKREPAKDVARVLGRYVDGIMARTFAHQTIIDLAEFSGVPVINALSDWSHPCQAMADVQTIKEHLGDLNGLKLAYVGDGNNVARSLCFVSAKFGMKCFVASPEGYKLDEESLRRANEFCEGAAVQVTDPAEAVAGAQVVYTDTWVSMGQEEEKAKRVNDFEGYQVNGELMSKAAAGAKVMHCLPAYRGYEITDEVVESENSIIFDQAENRLHFQRALLKKLLT